MGKLTFAMGLHNHQPVGNFEFVFEDAYNKSYKPFLDVLEEFPTIPVGLHFSGPLMDYIEDKHPDYVDRLRQFVENDQVEIIGGAYYEAILSMLPEKDRQGQILSYADHLNELFGKRPQGLWLSERVWEQNLTKSLANAGVKYVTLDDNHFKYAGLDDHQLLGYYLTEDEGRMLKILPISQKLRYYIPFQDPEKTIDYFRELVENSDEDILIIYADDGEKFGMWPQTYEHVYSKNKWLKRFFKLLVDNSDWVHLANFSDALKSYLPVGKIYLPDCSYLEMTEWALPAEKIREYENVVSDLKEHKLYNQVSRFIRGGTWRNFKIKYPEANVLYSKMMEVSAHVETLKNKRNSKAYLEATKELYQGQCNCTYWHGIFGGLYLPHLRSAAFEHLIKADTIISNENNRGKSWHNFSVYDFNLDGHNEVVYENKHHKMYINPSQGGMVYEHDLKKKNFNILATLSRKKEAYHKNLLEQDMHHEHEGEIASIHEVIEAKEEGLEKYLSFDEHFRGSFIDHIYPAVPDPNDIMTGRTQELIKFHSKRYAVEIADHKDNLSVEMSSSSHYDSPYGRIPLRIAKKLVFDNDNMSTEANYIIQNTHTEKTAAFWLAVELNYSLLAGHDSQRFFSLKNFNKIGELDTVSAHDKEHEMYIIDSWMGIKTEINSDEPIRIITYPVYTVSLSESGLEKVFQSAAVLLCKKFKLGPMDSGSLNFNEIISYM